MKNEERGMQSAERGVKERLGEGVLSPLSSRLWRGNGIQVHLSVTNSLERGWRKPASLFVWEMRWLAEKLSYSLLALAPEGVPSIVVFMRAEAVAWTR
jgi:hypothetical protein